MVKVVIVEYEGLDDFISSCNDNKDQLDSFLEALTVLIKYSSPDYINISKAKIVSDDNLFKFGFKDLSPGYKVAFLSFSDFSSTFEPKDDEYDVYFEVNELYKIWNAYMCVEGFLGR